MKNEFIVQHKISYQISRDDWDVSYRTLKVTDETTVREILEWYRLHYKQAMLEVMLIQIQEETK